MKSPDIILRLPLPDAVDYGAIVMMMHASAFGHGMNWTEITNTAQEVVLRGWHERPADYGRGS